MLDMYKGVVNSPETTITNDISNTDTIIYILDETRVPDELPNLMTLGTGTAAETIRVISVAGNALTVERGFQGVAKTWNAGTVIARNFTEYDYNALKENIEELEETKETPAGAQAKAEAAETNAKNFASGLIGSLSSLLTTAKTNIVVAINELVSRINILTGYVGDLDDDLSTHKAESAKKHIAESGSNPNGSYIKFDDGTMICSTSVVVSFNTAMAQDFPFPATFTSISGGGWTIDSPNGGTNRVRVQKILMNHFAGVDMKSNRWGIWFRDAEADLVDETRRFYLTAVGRWK